MSERSADRAALPRARTALSARRRIAGFAIAVVVGPPLLWALQGLRSPGALAIDVLSFQLLVVIVTLVGGLWPAMFAAVLSAVTLDLFFIEPHFTVAVADPVHAITLVLHVAIAALVSAVVDRAARETEKARRAAAESARLQPMAESDRVRGALLSALSHDLRRPLAAATTAVGGLRSASGSLSADDTRELLETADESLAALTALVTDLLDVSRVQAGALSISPQRLDPTDTILPAIDELASEPGEIDVRLGHDGADVLADPVLLQRALANLLANAKRYAPVGTRVTVETRALAERLEIRVVDHGPGVPQARRDDIFLPFQRLGDTDNTTGLGLGLALARGLVEAMQGVLRPEDTPGGGLTMVVSLPVAAPDGAASVTTVTTVTTEEGAP